MRNRLPHPLRVLSTLVLVSLLLQPVGAAGGMALARQGAPAPGALAPVPPLTLAEDGRILDPGTTYRARVTVRNAPARERLRDLGVVVLRSGLDWALVLADEEQLEALARLRYEPQGTDSLATLARANPEWLVYREVSRKMLASAPAVDSDGDGLTDTQEAFWCTRPMDPDSDLDGVSDGDEVQAAKDWLGNRRAGYPASGKPFAGWPPQIAGCRDDDQDSVPDLAERWELGLNMNRESTDRDKFDDGQELFGLTYCPGSGGYCGYGALPRNEDWGVIFAEMPAWVKAPGNHPLVAAFPVPEVDVVPSSLHVETVTTVTTDHTISSGTERSYSTARTEGTSTSVASTKTWNEWEEVSDTRPQAGGLVAQAAELGSTLVSYQATSVSVQQPRSSSPFGIVDTLVGLVEAPGKLWRAGQAIGHGINEAIYLAAAYGPPWNWSGHLDEYDEMQAREQLAKCQRGETCRDPATGLLLLDGGPYAVKQQNPDTGSQNFVSGNAGYNMVLTGNGATMRSYQPIEISVTIPPVPTHTETRGRSWGGSETTTNEQYEEHTITNSEAFSSSESWGTATAVNSAHAADLWFTYKVRNTGTEYAREIAGLAFNVYIGDDPNPAATYFVGPDLGGDGKFHNFMPAEEHTYTSRRIPLTLEQMKAVDLGGPVRIVVEDFTYGIDELFYQDAANAGVLVAVEDGTDDGDEAIDTYLIPTWGEETVLDVLARYFPHTADADGNLMAIWTPEFRADTPTWCHEPKRVGATLWCKHALSTADWWNVYTSGLGDGSEGFQDTLAAAGSVALFRFNRDTDLDGYSDRSETRLGTDPNDAASFPKPELIAGVHSIRVGNQVTATLSLLNTGLYDAYGVEAVMIAPDDSVHITNNTVGGSGRVRAQRQVVVGSRILLQSPLPAQWTQVGHARPAVGGYYTGAQDRTYTFTVQCGNPGGCDVGAGIWSLAWNDGAGGSGTLNFGAGYASPRLLDVGALGVKVGLLSGKAYNGESFTVAARTPRDTFQYTINREPYTEPIVLVSYNDPQGNHRFVTPVRLSTPTEDLAPYSGQMWRDPGVEIVTTAPYTVGLNTTNLVVNNPTDKTLTDAHLFLEFVTTVTNTVPYEAPPGTVAAEVPVTVTLPPGPSVVPVAWSTEVFSPTFQADQDYLVMAFWTDYEGNILDVAARPLSSFQEDPKAAFAMALGDEVWDFGTAQQGTLLQRHFALASVGYMDLLTHLGVPSGGPGIRVEGPGSAPVWPGDMAVYTVTLNTQYLDVGPFERVIPVRTSDPDHPTRTITITGEITPMPPDGPGGATVRPLDWAATIPGAHSQGEWVEFSHTLGPDPQTLHPVKVYSQDYATLWGVGKYATPFGQGTASYDMFGDGRDGDLFIGAGQEVNANPVRASVAGTASVGQSVIPVSSSNGFEIGDLIMIIQMQGPNAGKYHFAYVQSKMDNSLTINPPLSYDLSGAYQPTCGGGYWGEYFNNQNLSGTPYATRCDPQINFDWGQGPPLGTNSGQSNDHVSIRWTSQMHLPSGAYQVTACADDGIRVYLDDIAIIDQWRDQGYTCYSVVPNISEGLHSLRVEYYENTGNAGVHFILEPVRRTQVIRVPQFKNLTIQSGGKLFITGWNGHTGGVMAIRVSGILNNAGEIQAQGRGYRGGQRANSPGYPNNEYYPAMRGENEYEGKDLSRSSSARGVGGGAGGGDSSGGRGGGGGGGAGAPGSQGGDNGGEGGRMGISDPTLPILLMGGGGGGGGVDTDIGTTDNGADGAPGGGIVYVGARALSLNGPILAFGYNGGEPAWVEQGASGGGAGGGGSVKIIASNANVGTNLINVSGGTGGNGRNGGARGGDGGVGRIRIEYCESFSGSTNPPASVQKLNCYIAEQVESAPYTTTRLNLPESFTGGRTYQAQYGRRFVFGGAGEQTSALRVPAGAFTSAVLDALVSEVGTGSLTFRLDVGNDGSWDWEWTGNVDNAVTLNSPSLAAAFSHYWASHGAPTSGSVDVPVRVSLGKGGQVLLTNLRMVLSGSKVRHVRLPARSYGTVSLSLTVGESGSGPLTVAADVGDDGTVDWTWSGSPVYPARLTTGNLAAQFNAYLSGRTGEVDVPIRFTLSPLLALSLDSLTATPSARPDLWVTGSDLAFSTSPAVEGDEVTVTATLHNGGALDSGPLVAAFFARPPGLQEWYIGSDFVPNVPAGSTAEASILWNTLGYTGTVPVRVQVDPYNRVPETNEGNNTATANLTIRSRPDLRVGSLTLSDDEPVVGEAVTVSVEVANGGQEGAGAFGVGLYEGSPDSGGVLVGEAAVPGVPGQGTVPVALAWTPSSPGPYRLVVDVDRGGAVREYDEGNNRAWRDVYVGFRGPIGIDAGSAGDEAYTPERGYGYLDGTSYGMAMCGARPEETQRVDGDGSLRYRFDHLLPGHYYHLDLALYECDGSGRVEEVWVDDVRVAAGIPLGDGQVHRLSLRLDPALYADRSVVVTVKETQGQDVWLGEIALHDVDYRYADAGGGKDPAYTAARGYGYLDGVASTSWGTLPYQSRRVDLLDSDPSDDPDNELRYRFDGLDAEKRYFLHLTFFHKLAQAPVFQVGVDDRRVRDDFTVPYSETVYITTTVPIQTYAEDGWITVRITRTNATANTFVNEVALEEQTLPLTAPGCPAVTGTPYFTEAYGDVLVDGTPALAGTVVEAVSPRGEVVGCFVVHTDGSYGLMRIYGEDASANPPIPGMRPGETVVFRVGGQVATATPPLQWQDDKAPHRVDLNTGVLQNQTIVLDTTWSLVSFRLQPPSPAITEVLSSIEGKYDLVLGETGSYATWLPPVFNTLKELRPGAGYYVRLSVPPPQNLLISGSEVPVGTPIPLHQGWNWIGYLPQCTQPVTVALQSVEGNYDIVLGDKGSYVPSLPPVFNTLKQMEPGEGYLIRMTAADTLVYPACVGGLAGEPQASLPEGTCPGLEVTPAFALVYGEVRVNGQPARPGSLVQVWDGQGKELLGCGRVHGEGQFGLLRLYARAEGEVASLESFSFRKGLRWTVDGLPVVLVGEEPVWRVWEPHPVRLEGVRRERYLPLVLR